MKGYMYILECSDGSYYVGSTNDIELRLQQHQNGIGSNHTKKRLPVKLVYYEEFQRIDEAFYREKQVQGWSRRKKEALIEGKFEKLPELSKNYTQLPSTSSGTSPSTSSGTSPSTSSGTSPSTSSGTGLSTSSGTGPSTSSGIPVVEPVAVVELVETTITKEAVKSINEVVAPYNVPSTSSGTGPSTSSGIPVVEPVAVVEPVETTITKESVKSINEVVAPYNVPSTSSGTGF